MKKFPTITLAVLITVTPLLIQGQPERYTQPAKAYTHLAQFKVYDHSSKAPIERAVVTDQYGQELGYTGMKGDLALNVPPNRIEYYTIKADGYSPMNIRLAQAEKKKGEYEVFLPAAAPLSTTMENTPENDAANSRVKIYVREDPKTYQKKTVQGGEISFAVQVAASSRPITKQAANKEWEGLGSVYIHQENGMYKVRIGPYTSQQEAKKVLLDVKSKGRKDAFIVVMQSGEFDPPMEQVNRPSAPQPIEVPAETYISTTDMPKADYKVKIASYLHPGAFNPDGIDKLGTLESYRKGEWTIMMIGGFRTLDEARRARQIVVSKGFADASIVVDNGGIIETIEEK